MSIISGLKRAGLALILFVAVYAPAFVMVAWLHYQHLWCGDELGRQCPSAQTTIPLIIVVSAGLAALFMAFLARGTKGIAEFGVAKSAASYVIAATLIGIVVGGAVAYLAARYPASSPPIDVSKLSPWLLFVFFILVAPIQEEFIFRGLLQTMMARAVSVAGGFWAAHFPVVFVAVLFGVVHSGFGIVTVAGGILLGLIAGELRRMSGSLVPAIIVHALFNAASLWL